MIQMRFEYICLLKIEETKFGKLIFPLSQDHRLGQWLFGGGS
jgi:hypothetical protein